MDRSRSRIGLGSVLAISAASLGLLALANHAVGRMAERRHPARGRFVTVDGVRLHYIDRGSGPPVVLLHGNGAMAEDFELSGLLPIAARDHRVIAFDRPGFGYSERPAGRIWTAERQAALILKALDLIGVEEPLVVGHSWGTLVGLAMGLQRPERLRGLILLSGYYFPTLRADVPLGSIPAIPIVGNLLRHTLLPLLGRLMAPHLFRRIFSPAPISPRFAHNFPMGLSLRAGQLRATGAETALMTFDAARLARHYGELRTPVAIVAGDGDRQVSTVRQSAKLASRIPGAELRILPGAGHMIHYLFPAALAAIIRSFAAGKGMPRRTS